VSTPADEHFLESPDLVMRVPRATDLDALVHIDSAWSGAERRGYLEGRLRRALRPHGISLARVAERGADVVGFVFGEVTRGEFGRTEPVAWIDTIGVRRDQARLGVGTALLREFMSCARMIGAERVRTLLDLGEDALTDFLEAHGFRVAQTTVVERVVEP